MTHLLHEIANVGRAADGSYHRLAWDDATMTLRAWFARTAQSRAMRLEEDGNGNQIAWLECAGVVDAPALLLGSHLDSVPGGGAFDGPLGITSAFAALDRLRERGAPLTRPVGVANFADEEGGRFGVACLGSRLATGSLPPSAARELTDDDGATLAQILQSRGLDPQAMGPAAWVPRVAMFVELHIEQGRYLVDADAPVGVASAIWPHARHRIEFLGEGNHAGTTPISVRHDPMIPLAALVISARDAAAEAEARATVGKVSVSPGSANAIASRVEAWLDVRAPDDATLSAMADRIVAQVTGSSEAEGVEVCVVRESSTAAVVFDETLRDRMANLLDAPVIPTAAGHDAGVLAAHVPTGMLFVRNPTGVSHAPGEWASDADIEAGVDALVRVIKELT